MSRPAWINVGAQDSVGSATVTASTNTLTIIGHGLINGDIVMVDTLTGGADGPLIPGAVYFVRNVAGDDFQLSGTRGSQIKEYATDGTAEVYAAVPAYNAQTLRLNDVVTLFHGSADGLGAREGVRPGSGPVITVAGTTWTVHDHSGVVYPGLTSTSGPYRYHQIETSDSLDPADGANDRVDALDLVIEDDDEDASGFRQSRVHYQAGTPGGGAPALTPNALRLGTILVPSGGSPSPTVDSEASFTVASGGILPAHNASDLPTSGLYESMYADQLNIGSLIRWSGSTWHKIASSRAPNVVPITSSTTYNAPADLKYARVQVWGGGGSGGGCAATGGTSSAESGGGGGGQYREIWYTAEEMGGSAAVTIGAGGAATAAGDNDGNSGGSTTFNPDGTGATLIASGGNGGEGSLAGSSNHSQTGGTGGSGGVGGRAITGSDGGMGRLVGGAVASHANNGGSSPLGGGTTVVPDANSSGRPGKIPGGGASGGNSGNSQSARAGQSGARGEVRVTEFFT